MDLLRNMGYFLHIVAPSNVVIQGQKHGRLGESISMSCVSSISNPSATLSWRSPTGGDVSAEQYVVESALVSIVICDIYSKDLLLKIKQCHFLLLCVHRAVSLQLQITQ